MAAESYNKKGASNRTLLLTRLQKNKRGFLWVTLGFFLISLAAHWVFAWFTYVQEQQAHNQPIQTGEYFNMTFRDIMEKLAVRVSTANVAGSRIIVPIVCGLAPIKRIERKNRTKS